MAKCVTMLYDYIDFVCCKLYKNICRIKHIYMPLAPVDPSNGILVSAFLRGFLGTQENVFCKFSVGFLYLTLYSGMLSLFF